MKILKGDGHGGWYDQRVTLLLPKLLTVNYNSQEEEALHPKKILRSTKVAYSRKTYCKTKSTCCNCLCTKPKPKEDTAPNAPNHQRQVMHKEQTRRSYGYSVSEGVVVVFGRFNPPTVGHQKLLKSSFRSK